jgi:hypothetical protein
MSRNKRVIGIGVSALATGLCLTVAGCSGAAAPQAGGATSPAAVSATGEASASASADSGGAISSGSGIAAFCAGVKSALTKYESDPGEGYGQLTADLAPTTAGVLYLAHDASSPAATEFNAVNGDLYPVASDGAKSPEPSFNSDAEKLASDCSFTFTPPSS